MRASFLALGTVAVGLAVAFAGTNVWGQQVLDRLERILRDEVLPRLGTVPAPQRGDDPPASPELLPAVPPAAGIAPAAPPSGGQAGYFGVVSDDRDTRGRGVEVLSVREGGPAEAAGLKPGDVILALRGLGVRSLDEFAAALNGQPEGARIEVIFERGGRNYSTTVTLGTRPGVAGDGSLVPGEPRASRPVEPAFPATPPQLGVRVLTVTEAARTGFAVYVRGGAVIASLERGSPAERAGLRTGAVIVGIDTRRVNDPADLSAIVRTYRWGQTINVLYYRGDQLYRLQVPLLPPDYREGIAPGATTDPPLVLKPKVSEFPPSVAAKPPVAQPAPFAPRLPPGDAPETELVPPPPMPPASPPAESAAPAAPMVRKPVDLRELEERLSGAAPMVDPAAPAPAAESPPAADEVARLRTQMSLIREEAVRLREEAQKLERILAELQARVEKLEAPPPAVPPLTPPAPQP